MKFLIVSDSHGSTEILQELSTRYSNRVDAMIHCGDSELTADNPIMADYLTVRGNCDIDARFPDHLVKEMGGINVLVTHGHLFNVKMSLMNLSYKAKENAAQFVFFGHSHTLGAEMMDGTLFLNPGSILLPRGRREKTYALVEVESSRVYVRFLNENHEELVDLTATFSL
ncbi:putative phosphoesterase [Bacillus pakistanensis]|uniref:Phosphoesterase n=1 Tax=Rossellomorea pakistanensis TaxID=992288 RepID=A0ABS2NAI3_9BACI|nr:metallophosphoesterase [Bacillus pakistanensis]MBM7584870.1 putative phosphoesterase [Bacillus pakistanensis]